MCRIIGLLGIYQGVSSMKPQRCPQFRNGLCHSVSLGRGGGLALCAPLFPSRGGLVAGRSGPQTVCAACRFGPWVACNGMACRLCPAAATSTSSREEAGEKGGPGEAGCAPQPVPMPTGDSHEPRLGPRPRSHNKVLNPPGGKSSISFY